MFYILLCSNFGEVYYVSRVMTIVDSCLNNRFKMFEGVLRGSNKNCEANGYIGIIILYFIYLPAALRRSFHFDIYYVSRMFKDLIVV